jgi:N12 class adenine-specific DNA methylase
MFADRYSEFKPERDALRALVTDEEFDSARASTLNAHYTSPDVIKGMWSVLKFLGYKGGLALEPSAGVGHFIGLIPDDIASKTAWTGVELDSLTGRIAKALYGGAEINVHGFEELKRPSNYYDLAISNVPFGNYSLREEPYGAYPIHDFFFVKSLDKIRPGGIVAFVTSRYTMDRVDDGTRRQLAKTADLVGAIRLPGGDKGAFAKNAGTEVTTDIILLRKKIPGEEPFPGEDWLDLKEVKTPDGPVSINEYFAAHPEKMLGEMRLQGTMHAKAEPVLIGDTDNLDQKIRDAAAGMREGAFVERVAPRPAPVHANDVDRKIKEGGFFEKDGVIYRRIQGAGENAQLSSADAARVSKLIGMRDLYNDLLAEQLSPEHDVKKADALREALRGAYDAFVGEYGPINKTVTRTTKRLTKAGEPVTITKMPNFDAFKGDPDGWKVAAIENYDPETGLAKRSDVQVKDVLNAPTERKINGPGDALAAVLDETGGVDLNRVGELLGVGTEEEAAARLGDLIFQNPDGRQWETADKYLSGDVVKKLEEARVIARSDPGYLRNVSALEKVQPTPLTGTDITAQFGAPWIPEDVYETFIGEIGGVEPVVTKLPASGAFRLSVRYFTREAEAKYGTDRVKVKELVEAALNNREVSVYDTVDDKRVLNQKETEAARIKTEAIREAFGGDVERGVEAWAFAEPERAARLEAIYNRTYNNLAQRKFDGSHLTFPGLNEKFADRWYRKNAVWRIVQNGNTLLAHEVGSGKTVTMIAAGMEMRRLGLIRKPAYVVPNHMLEQFSREFIEAYPNAKILVASKDEMDVSARRQFIAKIAANDWDGVIITHDAFGRINVGYEARKQFIMDELARLQRARAEEAKDAGKDAPSVKDLEKAKKQLLTRLNKLLNEPRKDAGTSFEETGIDHLFVDEAHKFKNLAFVTRQTRIKGLSQGDAQRAEDLFLKIRYIEQNKPGRSAVFATGTPVSNTMAELWTMMRYLELDRLKQAGLDHFDAWASTFGKIVSTMELSADGRTFREVKSFSKFVNVPELISLYSEISDTKTADMLNLERPEVRTRSGAPGIEIVEATPSEAEERHIESLVRLAESLRGKKPEKGKPNMLSVVMAGRKVATDGRLISGEFDFNPRGKIALAVDNIHRIWKEGKEPGMVQMVFLDLGVPKTRSEARAGEPEERGEGDEEAEPVEAEAPRIDLYADLKARLVAKGIPAREIAAVHDAKDDAAKARLFAKVRSGEIRVIIGSSEKMGVGTNVQDKLIAMHHLDAPWRPADVAQRDGRIVRQGNQNPSVQIYRYVSKRSFDAFMWQKLDTKSKFIGQVLSGAKGSRHAEDIDNPLPEAAEMKAAASGDPRIMELAELDRSVRAMTAQRRVHEATVQRATWESKAAQSRIREYEQALPSAEADAKRVTDLAGDKFVVELGGKPVTSRKEAGEQIMARLLALHQAEFFRPTIVKLGRMSGLEMNIELRAAYDDGYYLIGTPMLKGESVHSATNTIVINQHTDSSGLIRRYESMLARTADQPQRLTALLAQERATVEKLAGTLGAKWPRQAEYQAALAKAKALADQMRAPKHPDVAEAENAQAQANKPLAAEQPGVAGPEPRGMVELRQGVALIKLFETADRSTFMHESAHLWLDEMMRDAETAPPGQIQADRDAVLEWLGVKSRDEIGPAQHEKWAGAFERYLADGRAPSGFLAQAFENFKRWLIEIYHSLTGMGAPIPADIRGVMDRMIATDEEIAAARRAAAPLMAAPPVDRATAAQQGWAALQDGKGDPDGAEVAAFSEAADAAPEPVSVEGFRKAQPALEKSVADAEAAWREVEPFMEQAERDTINAALLRTTEDAEQRATALRELVGCLLVATP